MCVYEWMITTMQAYLIVILYVCSGTVHDICSVSALGPSTLRLVGGRNQYEGRVEVNRSGEWQTVCDYYWDIKEAEVVCRQLGYGYAILAIQRAAFGQGTGGQWYRYWTCNGNEASLNDCRSSSVFCTHFRDASVICSGNGETYVYSACPV